MQYWVVKLLSRLSPHSLYVIVVYVYITSYIMFQYRQSWLLHWFFRYRCQCSRLRGGHWPRAQDVRWQQGRFRLMPLLLRQSPRKPHSLLSQEPNVCHQKANLWGEWSLYYSQSFFIRKLCYNCRKWWRSYLLLEGKTKHILTYTPSLSQVTPACVKAKAIL